MGEVELVLTIRRGGCSTFWQSDGSYVETYLSGQIYRCLQLCEQERNRDIGTSEKETVAPINKIRRHTSA